MNRWLMCWLGVWLVLSLAPWARAADTTFDPGTLDYSIEFRDRIVQWREFAFFVMPGEASDLRIPLESEAAVRVSVTGGQLNRNGPGHWRWRAPAEPGLVVLDIHPESDPPMRLRLFVMTPLAHMEGQYLNGYRIGRYPEKPLKGNPIYRAPQGLMEVDASMLDIPLSPHFTLGQFLCKQQEDHWPKYLIVRSALLAKLERLLAEVNRQGIRTETFHVMSGYRTPWYNAAIGNGAYSRHIWGGAADIFIDTDNDGRMDDLNGDGRITIRDAKVLHAIVEGVHKMPRFQRLIGGLGLYGPRPHRGPFVHVDARGHDARWSMP